MMKTNKYFRLDEFKCKCGKCEIPSNVPSDELIDLLVQIREHYNKPIIINSGYRCPEHNAKVGGSPKSQHCFSEDTEILTSNGWRNFKTIDLKNDLAYSLNLKTNKIELKKIDNYICYPVKNYPMFNFRNRYNDILVTEKHRIIYRLEKNKKSKNNSILVSNANEINYTRFKLLQGAETNSSLEPDNINFIYMCIAIICDGCIHKKNHTISFRFLKDRKVKRINELLKSLNIKFKERTTLDGYICISLNKSNSKIFIDTITNEKKIPKEWLKYNSDTLKKIILEYCFFDGCYDTGYSYEILSSIDKYNIEILRIFCLLSGWTSYITKRDSKKYNIKGKKGKSNEHYVLSITKKNNSSIRNYKPKIELYNGLVWCISNENTTLVTKRNDKISIQGNCIGSAVDFIVKGVKTEEVYNFVLEKWGEAPLGIAIKRNANNPHAGFVHLDTRGKKARWEYK